jgi:ribonuclease P protein component
MQAELRPSGQSRAPHTRKPHSLRKHHEFQRVRQQGRSVSGVLLSLGWAANDLLVSRCGYVVGKRVGGAVARNRVKRRLREIMRLTIKADQLAPGYDLVWIARTSAAQATYQQLAAEAHNLLRRARLWRAESTAPVLHRLGAGPEAPEETLP